ncbi:hypothetical protein [Empedobacter brevis]|uniref:hypothetical protein n=1 Tax=Empedobacter brevis TaxID=247 RepID=UPI0028A1C6EC|nr:hypothetical protein [Empedobacter brevis]
MQIIHAYIHFPENIDNDIQSREGGLKILKDFQMAIDLADCEKSSKLYYSKTNKDSFLSNIQALEELSDFKIGGYEFGEVIEILFNENDVKAVNENTIEGCEVKSYQANGSYLVDDIPLIFYDIIRRHDNITQPDKQIILNLLNAFFSQNPVLLLKHCGTSVTPIQIEHFTSFTELDTWLENNRIQRNFNNTDTRHIHGSPDYIPGKSPLLGGIGGRPKASELLKNALGDKRRNDNVNDLVNFDEETNEYLWYEYEGDNPQNQYHAYHLVLHNNHQTRDKVAVGRITSRVIAIIEYRKSLL